MFSVIIPTMWKSPLILEMLPKYEKSKWVGEVIIIDNEPESCYNTDMYSKVRTYTKGTNIFVNPAWNFGVSFSNYDIIIANDDILIDDLDKVLTEINKADFDLIGVCYDQDNKGFRIEQTYKRPNNSFGSFMYVKNYTPIPDQIKIWGGDTLLFLNSKKTGWIVNGGFSTNRSTTIDSNKSYFKGVIGANDRKELKKYLSRG